MTARIVVQSGTSAGNVFWIQRPVIRLGSDPSMDLCLPSPGLEPHVMTIEFRSTDYRVYNRGSQPFYIAELCLSPGQSHTWLESDLLELPDGQQLAIELDVDPSPGPASDPYGVIGNLNAEPDSAAPREPQSKPHTANSGAPASQLQGPAADATPQARSSGSSGQWLVIAFCIILGGFLLLRHQFQANSSVATTAPEFEQVILDAIESQKSLPQGLIGQLQFAEAAAVAGNRPAAFERYSRLRDFLLTMQPTSSQIPEAQDLQDVQEENEPVFRQILLLVEHRLSQLAK